MNIEFHAHGIAHSFSVTALEKATTKPARAGAAVPRAGAALQPFDAAAFVATLRRSKLMRLRLPTAAASGVGVVNLARARGVRAAVAGPAPGRIMTLLTPSIIVEGARTDDMKAAKNAGARILNEGFDGKTLLGVDSLAQMSSLIALLTKREVGSVSPNFLRRFTRTPLSTRPKAWAHAKIKLAKAWAITKGVADVRIAVLDEGVDTSHPALQAAVVGQRDFIGDKGASAMPDGNDAHGTACAGIIVSRRRAAIGIAPKCSLLAARIAMDDGTGHWVFDDFATADAIDWSWRNGAAVLSNSWGGGAPSDAISRAFGRARTQGRGGRGSVVCIAAGNDQIPIDSHRFPGQSAWIRDRWCVEPAGRA